MRNGFATSFWHSAYQSLPVQVRKRYAADLQAAERWELQLDALIEAWSRTKNLFSKAAPAH